MFNKIVIPAHVVKVVVQLLDRDRSSCWNLEWKNVCGEIRRVDFTPVFQKQRFL